MAFKWESNIRKVVPYVPGEQPKDQNIIKLNTNENPYPPSPKVTAMIAELDTDIMRKYPDPTASELVEKLAEYHGMDKSNIFVGVGSDDVLGMSFMTFFNSDRKVLFPDITYSFYPVWCDMLRIPYEQIPLKDDFTINYEDYLGESGGVVIANPNAPTGILLDKDKIIKIIEANTENIVIVDEAYIDFAPEGASCIDLVKKYDNLLVVRTYSKSRNLAGLRVGYAIGQPALIKYLNDVKYSYNSYTMNYPSIKIGAAVIDDDEYFKKVLKNVVATREWFAEEIKKMGFEVLPSSTNFVFAKHEKKSGNDIFEALKAKGIFVRHFKQDRIDDYLRITIGTDEEMKAVVEFFKEYLG